MGSEMCIRDRFTGNALKGFTSTSGSLGTRGNARRAFLFTSASLFVDDLTGKAFGMAFGFGAEEPEEIVGFSSAHNKKEEMETKIIK